MSRHLADHGHSRGSGRVRAFFRIARQGRGWWHRSESVASGRRVVEFIRLARGYQEPSAGASCFGGLSGRRAA
ncbi:hypothetical protein HYN69_17005 [Gemmobacter aquarius]|uniref:Uncharacterized protein n=1 Tax=Paragemmobacter aquarius TaxID=2169400 RepID=A0A2S0UQ70_9RHOB|nr:hypothetical protein HYN69_17005 [Gemmobacter aquarius]